MIRIIYHSYKIPTSLLASINGRIKFLSVIYVFAFISCSKPGITVTFRSYTVDTLEHVNVTIWIEYICSFFCNFFVPFVSCSAYVMVIKLMVEFLWDSSAVLFVLFYQQLHCTFHFLSALKDQCTEFGKINNYFTNFRVKTLDNVNFRKKLS